jgi:hypothetical protein
VPNIGNWLTSDPQVQAQVRAAAAWRRIQEKASSVAILRGSTPLAAQTVRLEFDNTVTETAAGGAGRASIRKVTLFGIRDHATEANTNVQRGDAFSINGVQYRVVDVVYTIGEVQATAEASG